MAGNRNLNSAKTARKDEFYTQLTDIEKEMRYYRKHFKGKTVLCNCDDPFESNFFKYFVLNFNRLGLKKLIATCYSTSPIAGNQLQYYEQSDGQLSFSFDEKCSESADSKRPYKAVVTKVYDVTGDGGIDMVDVAELFKSGDNALTQLNGDGDFRSLECVNLLDEADIVVTIILTPILMSILSSENAQRFNQSKTYFTLDLLIGWHSTLLRVSRP